MLNKVQRQKVNRMWTMDQTWKWEHTLECTPSPKCYKEFITVRICWSVMELFWQITFIKAWHRLMRIKGPRRLEHIMVHCSSHYHPAQVYIVSWEPEGHYQYSTMFLHENQKGAILLLYKVYADSHGCSRGLSSVSGGGELRHCLTPPPPQ